jgi:hypothetical protein
LPFGTSYISNMGSVDLRRLVGLQEGITNFMVTGSSSWALRTRCESNSDILEATNRG